MRRNRYTALVPIAILAMGVGAYASAANLLPPRPLTPTLGISFSPRLMPANEYVPVSVDISAEIQTSDGTHPSALREAAFDVDRHLKVNVRNLPVCKPQPRYDRSTRGAVRECGEAIVGRGSAHFEIAFPEQEPLLVDSPIAVFNGGESDGKLKLFIHAFIRVPRPTAIVAVATIERQGRSLHSTVRIPVIAGGAGSLIDFEVKLGRTRVHRDKKVGLLEARCPDGKFRVNVPKLLFKNEAKVPHVPATTTIKGTLFAPCTPKG